jgi:hypothetical protein
MRISENRYTKDMRKYELARRMIAYEVRTKTITAWTGLTKYRIQTLFREYPELGKFKRHRGEPPSQPAFFSRSLLHEAESSALATIELEMSVIPIPSEGEFLGTLATLARGERLLNAFDLFRTLVPEPKISLEHAVLLTKELARGYTLSLHRCARCGGLMVVDRLGRTHVDCAFCRTKARTPKRPK